MNIQEHPEFSFADVAAKGVQNRKVVDVTKLGSPAGLTDTYMTYFRYNSEMIEHVNNTGSVRNFQGQAWSDWLPIDIDSSDLEEAQNLLTTLCSNLEDYDIDLNTCRFYFSGAKGFHVMIPSEYFQPKPCNDIHKRFRKIALTLAKGINIDTAIYDKTRLFRLPNTINSKTGLYKIELYPFDCQSLSIEEIKARATEPVGELEIDDDFYPSQELTILFHEELYKKPENKEKKTVVKSKICMETIMKGIGEGERDNSGLRVAAHLRQSGLTPKMIYAALDEWNQSNNPPLNTDELNRLYDQGLQNYEFGCHDPILKAHCSKDCIFYKEEWGRL